MKSSNDLLYLCLLTFTATIIVDTICRLLVGLVK